MTADTPPVFDRAHLARFTGGDAALEAELIGLLDAQIDGQIAAMAGASDEERWKAAAHTLKGAARGIGAMALGESCAQAELAPLDPERIEAMRVEAARFRAEVQPLVSSQTSNS